MRVVAATMAEDLMITEDDLLAPNKKINFNKAARVDGIPGTVVKLIVERTTEQLVRALNEVNRSGKSPAIWKVAKVVLIPKPGKDPPLPSSFRQISVLSSTQ